jgi:hypothetical protein
MRYRFRDATYRNLNALYDDAIKPLHPDAIGCFVATALTVLLPGDPVPETPGVPFVACVLVHYPIVGISRTLTTIESSASG